jgi:molybdopterin-guanine dinucleotide biosynthesis protein A
MTTATMRGAILAGGGATRFDGRPKGLERVGGVRIVDRLERVIAEAIGERPFLVANAAEASGWLPGAEVVRDRLAVRGSLSGIYTAVSAAGGPVLVVAWDMPFVPAGLLRALAEGSEGYDVFLPASGGRRGVEPLCGVYGPACAPAILRQLERKDFRAIGFHREVKVGILPLEEVARYGDVETIFFNVNTFEDLARAEELWRKLSE